MDEKIFERIEKKYLLDSEQYRQILKTLKEYMEKDDYYKSEVMNIYFDTKNYDLIIKSIENPDFKEKLRARSYGGYDKVFLEIKTKMLEGSTRVGHKRRALVTRQEYADFTTGQRKLAGLVTPRPHDIQIAREVDYMVKHFKLEPKVLVYYNRESYMGDNKLRVTFDTDLRFREEDLRFEPKNTDKRCLRGKRDIIMEIKTHGAMPLWLVHTLSTARAFPERFSKIGKAYEIIKKGEHNV